MPPFEQQEFYSARRFTPLLQSRRSSARMTTVEHKRGNVLVRAALALVLFKIFVLLLSLGSRLSSPTSSTRTPTTGTSTGRGCSHRAQATRLATWDAQHYLFLATEGYQAGQRSITFFPLFPWLIRLTAALPGIGPLAAALLVANALSVAAIVLLHKLIEQRHPGIAADSVLLLLAFPGALFFHFPYTESLFLFLAVAGGPGRAVAKERRAARGHRRVPAPAHSTQRRPDRRAAPVCGGHALASRAQALARHP